LVAKKKNLKEINYLKDLDTESNIILKYVLEDITLGSVGYTYLAQNREKWRDLVNKVINFRIKN
jgi:hypothetical protein